MAVAELRVVADPEDSGVDPGRWCEGRVLGSPSQATTFNVNACITTCFVLPFPNTALMVRG